MSWWICNSCICLYRWVGAGLISFIQTWLAHVPLRVGDEIQQKQESGGGRSTTAAGDAGNNDWFLRRRQTKVGNATFDLYNVKLVKLQNFPYSVQSSNSYVMNLLYENKRNHTWDWDSLSKAGVYVCAYEASSPLTGIFLRSEASCDMVSWDVPYGWYGVNMLFCKNNIPSGELT